MLGRMIGDVDAIVRENRALKIDRRREHDLVGDALPRQKLRDGGGARREQPAAVAQSNRARAQRRAPVRIGVEVGRRRQHLDAEMRCQAHVEFGLADVAFSDQDLVRADAQFESARSRQIECARRNVVDQKRDLVRELAPGLELAFVCPRNRRFRKTRRDDGQA
jgi:hypothetical protein